MTARSDALIRPLVHTLPRRTQRRALYTARLRSEGNEQDLAMTDPVLAAALSRQLHELIVAVGRDGLIRATHGGGETVIGPESVGAHILDFCHPEDLPSVARFAREALATEAGWEGRCSARLPMRDGSWRYHELHVANLLDDPVVRGFAIRLRALDPGREVHVVPAPSALRQELETLAGAIPLPIMFLDRFGAPLFMNHAARDLCAGLTEHLEIDGFTAIADIDERQVLEETLRSLYVDGGERTLAFRLLPYRPGAPERMVEATFASQGGPGQLFTAVVTLVDVSAHHARETELRRMASCDPLTGLLNRAEIEEALAGRLRVAPERVALLYCDLDGFKAVNDTHGHDVGDELLVEIAQILQAKTRPDDLVGRLGGDEFAVLIDSPDPSDAHGLACRIAVAIAELSSYRRLPVTASVGAATAKPGDSTRDLLRRADAAMYDEKRRRRERISRAG